ncbi:MAG TPA: hypothetical protein VIG06_02120 [Kofleriaceae bacterium]
MPRAVEFEVVADTSAFSAIQLQPSLVASTTWNALARWLRAYIVPFPDLIAREQVGLVVLGFHLQYGAAASFFDCPALTVRGALRIMRRGERGQFDIRFSADKRVLATARLILCPVAIRDPIALGAEPAPIPEHLCERFQPDELESASPERPVPERLVSIETQGRLLAEGRHSFTIHRHLSEVAEQWAWTGVPGLSEAARERLALGDECDRAVRRQVRRCLEQPVARFDVEFGRPFFSFETGEIVTRAYAIEDRLGLVHRFTSESGGALHATVVETF